METFNKGGEVSQLGAFKETSEITTNGYTLNWTATSLKKPSASKKSQVSYFSYCLCEGSSLDEVKSLTFCSDEKNLAATTKCQTDFLSFAVTGKTPGKSYFYNVAVLRGTTPVGVYEGLEQKLAAVESSNKDTSDKETPKVGAFSASTAVTDGQLTLNWSAATDNVTNANSLEYLVCRGASAATINSTSSCEASTVVKTWTKNLTTLAVTGLTPATSYAFNVAKDAAGNEAVYTRVSQATDNFCGGNGLVGTPYQICTLRNLNSMPVPFTATAACKLNHRHFTKHHPSTDIISGSVCLKSGCGASPVLSLRR
jgi:hypothetical protein